MIRYPCDQARLEADIRAEDARWFEKAKKRAESLVRLGCYDEKSSIWSSAKPAFMQLQMNKCVYCERQFENKEFGAIEFDLEHFRPKGAVKVWPDPQVHPNLSYGIHTGHASGTGYYWLAYDLQNYAASCKVCNTIFKLDYFPVSHARGSATHPVAALASEKPFLCYPIGTIDDDPEDLVTFRVTTAVPAQKSGHGRQRGRIIIDFFGLNDREVLHRERARMISIFGGALLAESKGHATSHDKQLISKMGSSMLPHSACLRAFRKFWAANATLAEEAYQLCREYAVSDAVASPPQGITQSG